MLKILLIDDEIQALEILEWKLKKNISDVEIATCSSPSEALSVLKEFQPQIVFLDVQMPEMDGFSFLEKVESKDFKLIFTTASDQFALKAIKEDAINYLLKPVDEVELVEAVEKARAIIDKDNIGEKLELMMKGMESQVSKVSISADGRIYLLDPQDVIMLQSDKSYTTIFLESGKKILVSKTLKEVEKKFNYKCFYRVHNSYLINLNHVKVYMKKMGGELILTNDLKASVSRNKKVELLQKFQSVK